MKGSTLLIIGAAIYLYLDNFALNIETSIPEVNNQLKLPVQIPLKDLLFNLQGTPSGLVRLFISPVQKNKIINIL